MSWLSKGQTIALTGNTSEGPHLHFEFRDSKTKLSTDAVWF
jgi:murein DD-endopeptidase MepM/ murein hydrolase activator NlpD